MARAALFGTPIAPGIAIGAVHFLHSARMATEKRHIAEAAVAGEQEALRRAALQVRHALEQARAGVPEGMDEYRDVIAAQMELARDPKLLDAAIRRVAHKKICAAWALSHTVDELCALFQGMDDPYLRDRAQDIRTVGLRLAECLAGRPSGGGGDVPCILAAEDISPADVMELKPGSVLGILTQEGGLTSHTAILSRGMHIPALTGVSDLLATAREGEEVILDGLSGCVLLGPDAADLARYTERRDAFGIFEARTSKTAHWPAETCDGVQVRVQANLENTQELDALARNGAEGVGLYRTEFAFFKKEQLPSEEDLYNEYAAVTTCAAPLQVVFRTLDTGADKMLRNQAVADEPNPALGLRGIRFCLRYQRIFRTQLRALLRAGALGNVAIMLPMISNLDEIITVRRILHDLEQELAARHIPHAERLPLGIMVETPAAVLESDILARECDFFSIGTNDLVHYIMAIDRGNRHVAYLHDPLRPAVLRAFKQVIDAGHREGIPVSVCGELVTDPGGLALLLGMGVDGISMAPQFLPGVKHMIRQLNARTCEDLAKTVLRHTDMAVSHRLILEMLRQSLGTGTPFYATNLMKN